MRVRPLRRDDALPAAQFVAMAGLLWPGRPRWRLPVPVTAVAAGLVAAGTVLAEEGLRCLGGEATPSVEPRPGAALRTQGPYELSRNPVYAGLIVGGTGLAVLRRRPEPLIALAVLAGVLHVKVGVEERHLRERFGEEFEAYARRTPRLIGMPTARIARRDLA